MGRERDTSIYDLQAQCAIVWAQKKIINIFISPINQVGLLNSSFAKCWTEIKVDLYKVWYWTFKEGGREQGIETKVANNLHIAE